MLDRKDNVEKCHTNTCEWIFERDEYQSWKNKSRGLLWIKGKPGAGKSTLMKFLHESLQIQKSQAEDQTLQLDFFFSARGTELQRTPLGMLRSLLNQIFDRDATVRPQMRESYEKRCKQFGYGERTWEWPRSVLEDLLASVILESANQQTVKVFVDALDEAGAESAQQLAAYFHRLVDRAGIKEAALKVCISCRHYPIMENVRAMEIHVEDHNGEDIAIYINDMLIDIDLGKDPTQLVGELTQQANGLFQWAQIMMPLIRRKYIEGESFEEIRSWLCEVPAGLEDVYIYTLRKVIEARNRELSFQLFQWVCLAERPLTMAEMRYALVAKNAQISPFPMRWEDIHGFIESDDRMKRRIKTLSGGLVGIAPSQDNNETVQVVHQSVNDFLRDKGLWILSFDLNTEKFPKEKESILLYCHADLYRSCLIYLSTTYRQHELLDEKEGQEAPIEEKERRYALIRDHPFVHYATTYLFIHAEKAASSRSAALQNEKDILQQVGRQWTEYCRFLNRGSYLCPPRGTTILHMAAAANLDDLLDCISSWGKDFEKSDNHGNTAFHSAARRGQIKAGKILLQNGADSEAKNIYGFTALMEAAGRGHVEFVHWLLPGGMILDEETAGDALQKASSGGYRSVVELFLGAGADVNTQGGRYGTALQAAASFGRTEIVRLLLNAHANVNAQGGHYGNALQAAVYYENLEIVRLLLDAHADINAQGGEFGNALQAAASSGSTEIVHLLLDAHAEVNAQGGYYGSALQAAAWEGSSEIVRLLLNAHADVNTQGGKYGNALLAAIQQRNLEIVHLLLDAHADVNTQGGYYGNALQAAVCEGSSEIVHLLLNAHADTNAQGGFYGNALQAAISSGKTKIVSLLLNAHADVNTQGGHYGNALQAATWNGNFEIVRLLLDAHADVNAQGGYYGNALQAATQKRSSEIVCLLLDAHADVNVQGGYYGNALQAAASSGSTEIVHLLLDADADVNAQGGYYGNALQAAAFFGETEMVHLLLDAHADVNAQGGFYGNALQGATASHSESDEKIKTLLDAHANVNAQGGYHDNTLQAAVLTGRIKTIKMLLKAGADVSIKGGIHGSALLAAFHMESSDIVQLLLHAGADMILPDGLHRTPLHLAASSGMLHILQRFPELTSAIHNRDKLLQTPLHLAVTSGHEDVAKMLLHLGADPSLQDGYGRHVMD
ncbi:hypothetical protein N7466_010243 [Penicillium verhagenii]|uniref:uncharacterized protein n=1 Tax=Penicillium verhagenii TaxID=1562060 RepID=UPI0025456BDE|nr:uncharacterized protein N7466_010243 [Penicillium verhagenii]KAJ5919300.1 hypothetical protein N7466_010243 [Penicillium verhagenii]